MKSFSSAKSRQLRICLLTNQDLNDLPDDDWPCDPRPFLPDAKWELVVLDKTTAVAQVVALARRRFDVFFNLCDGAWDEEDNPGVEVVKTLERLNLPFTGADSQFFEPSREAMKRVCRQLGIDTPAYVFAHTLADVRQAARELSFPLFVKHPSSYASVGLTRDSRVEDEEGLLNQARIMIKDYGGALIEEFIEGTECTVLVAENPEDPNNPVVYQPIQFRFPEGDSFKHSDMKWVIYEDLETTTIKDKKLERLLRDISARFFLGMNGTSYGRCDLRVDAKGRAFMLEINANCGLYYPPADASSADFCLQAEPDGHESFTRLIIESALKRHARRSPRWEVRARNGGGYGMFTTRRIRSGETIVFFEAKAHRLVSRSHVETTWTADQQAFFRRTAWPLTEEIYVARSCNPNEWKPIRHSCDPNAWLEGLDVVARRPIKKGEEVTLDYATVYNEQMSAFECNCDARRCRGIIHGEDHLLAFVERYGDHLSDYVRRKREQAGGSARFASAARYSASPAPQSPDSTSSTTTATHSSSSSESSVAT